MPFGFPRISRICIQLRELHLGSCVADAAAAAADAAAAAAADAVAAAAADAAAAAADAGAAAAADAAAAAAADAVAAAPKQLGLFALGNLGTVVNWRGDVRPVFTLNWQVLSRE